MPEPEPDDGLCHGHSPSEYRKAFEHALEADALEDARRILVRFAIEHPRDEGLTLGVRELAEADRRADPEPGHPAPA